MANDRSSGLADREFFGFEEGVLGFSIVPDDSVDQPVGPADQPGGPVAPAAVLKP